MVQISNRYIILTYAFMVAFVILGYVFGNRLYDKIVLGVLWELLFLPITFGGTVLCVYALRKNIKNKSRKSRQLTIVLSTIILMAFLVNLYFVIAQFSRSISAILS